VHHVEGEGETGGFKVEAMIVYFLFSIKTAVLSRVRNGEDTYPNILIDFTSSGEVADHAARSFQAAFACFVEPWRSGTLFTLVAASRWGFILFHDSIAPPSCSKDEERTECEK
jgi:hypothetical protein